MVKTHGMEHAMEVLLRTMKSHIHCSQENRSCGREDEESEARTLGFRCPGVCLLEVLEGIDREA